MQAFITTTPTFQPTILTVVADSQEELDFLSILHDLTYDEVAKVVQTRLDAGQTVPAPLAPADTIHPTEVGNVLKAQRSAAAAKIM